MTLLLASHSQAELFPLDIPAADSKPVDITVSSYGFDTSHMLQAALDKVGAHGGTLRFTPGIYPLQRTVVLHDTHDVHIIGAGATLKAAARMQLKKPGSLLSIDTAQRVVVEGLNFDGNAKTRQFDNGPQNIYMYVAKDVLIKDCTFKNSVCDDIFMWGGANPPEASLRCEHVRITGCKFDGAGRNAISVVNGAFVRIDHNLIQNVRGTDPYAGVDIEANTGDPDGITHDVLIDNNKVVNAGVGFTAKIPTHPKDLWIIGNQIEQCTYAVINEGVNCVVAWNTMQDIEKFAVAGGAGGSALIENNTLIRCKGTFIVTNEHKIGSNTIK